LTVHGDRISFSIGERLALEARDSRLSSGGAGFLIEEGTVPALGFAVHGVA
jgi:hypothetical protein